MEQALVDTLTVALMRAGDAERYTREERQAAAEAFVNGVDRAIAAEVERHREDSPHLRRRVDVLMAYLKELSDKCRRCEKRAVVEVFTWRNESAGKFCRPHGRDELARLRRVEVAAQAMTVRDRK